MTNEMYNENFDNFGEESMARESYYVTDVEPIVPVIQNVSSEIKIGLKPYSNSLKPLL